MLLHSTISQSPLLNHQSRVSLSSSLSNTLSFPSGFRSSTFLRPFRKAHNKDPIVCCSLSSVERSKLWNSLYRRISFMENPEMGAESVLNQLEKEGKSLIKLQLWRTGQELRKFGRYKLALEVFEWMNNRAHKFNISSRDAAIELGLIAKVRGILDAEDYFLKLSDTLKDTPTYCALLSVYVFAKSREKAESLMEKMKAGGYAKHSQAYNMMMSLYMRHKEHDKVDLVASEMRQENISLDAHSYNILISSLGARGSVEKMEQVFEQMKMERTIKLGWSTFTTMASMYIKVGELEKAEIYIKRAESIIDQDKIPYHHVITLYCSVGKKKEVYRVWNVYKSKFLRISNLSYNIMISSLVRLDDIEGAELIYEEWKSTKSTYEPRIINALMSLYVRNELFVKTEALFDQISELGGKRDSRTWEILAERYIKESRVSDALTCLKEALLVDGSTKWKPRPANASSIFKICEKNDDAESKDVLMGLLRQVGCFENEAYMSFIPSIYNKELPMEKGTTDDKVDEDKNGDEPELLLNVLQKV